MDALALLCNLHGDGPETLRRLRAAGCLDLAQVGELPRAQLDRLLGRGSLAAERFRREGRLLEKRLGGDVALADGVAATDALGRSNEARELREWADADRDERGRSDASTGDAAVPGAADAAEAGGLVHPFPPRKQPGAVTSNDGASRAEATEDAAGGSVLGAFLNRWRDAPQEQPADVSAAERSGAMASKVSASNAMASDVADEAPSAIRQLAEWAQQTRATQAGIRSEVEPNPTRDEERPAPPEPREPERQHKSRGKRAQTAPAAESAPPPRTSGRASELLDHWAAQGAAPTDVRPTVPATQAHEPNPGSATQPPSGHGVVGKAPAGGTPLGRLPGGERCGPSLEALAFAGLTCLEDLTQAPARQLAERSGLPYTEVLRLQFLAERYLSRS